MNSLTLDCIFYSVPEINILRGAYLQVERGKICALFGLNGSGKTTLLRVAAGQIQADSGITIIDGVRFSTPSRRQRFEKIAYLPQDSMLPSGLSVKRLRNCIPDGDDPILDAMLDCTVGDLSGGERRYLEAAIILGLGRDYVLLDEPFTGVEPMLIDRICARIRTAASAGAGVLLTDHYHHYSISIADEGYLMHQNQCYRLGGDVESELAKKGYINAVSCPSKEDPT